MDASDAAAMPLPSEDTTPPVTNIRGVMAGLRKPIVYRLARHCPSRPPPGNAARGPQMPGRRRLAGVLQLPPRSAAGTLLFFLFALPPGLVAAVLAAAGGFAALGALGILVALALFLGLVLGKCALRVLRRPGLGLRQQGHRHDGGRHHGHYAPQQM